MAQKDALQLFDNAVAITVTRDSTDYIKANANEGTGQPLFVQIQVGTAFTAVGAGTLDIDLQSSANTTNGADGAWVSLAKQAAIPKASLVAGARFQFQIPPIHAANLKLVYTVGTGPMTAGTVTAEILPARQLVP